MSAETRREPVPPAMVLGLELNGLGVVRSLARAGIEVLAVDDDLRKPGMRTRYGRKLAVRALHGRMLVEDLVQMGRLFPERPVLFITQEATVATISRYRDELSPWYRMTLADADCLRMLMNKESFQRFAERHGFRVPRSLHIRDDGTMRAACALRFPVILKPACRDAAYSRSFDKAYQVPDFDALRNLCRKIMPVLPDLIVQEWVEGSDSDIYFCLQYIGRDDGLVASFTGRKVRSWPPHTGGTASCIAAPEAEAELTAMTSRFFRAAGFVGMGSMEFKRDTATGKFFLIEPTVGRTDYQEEVATLNGVNIPVAAWRSEAGLGRLPAAAKLHPVVWRESVTDRWSAQLQHQRQGRGVLDSGRKIDGWLRWHDPMPALDILRRRIRKAACRRIDRVRLAKGSAI
ncbi:MAG TPA: FAD-dependent oxidoreductase [Gammaproteobacteria bacterium]|nr:FAD-dependent oxidoreductase [Gammaproteobacteria bacterium]